MKTIWLSILFIFIFMNLIAQNSEYEIKITDLNDDFIYFHKLTIDDSIYVLTERNDVLSDKLQIYKISLPDGEHKINASIEDCEIIDTIFVFHSDTRKIHLYVNMKRNFHFHEFKEGFNKIYTNKDYLPIIGLKDDGTFLLRSFFHISIIGCFQYERGRYKIEENKLILDVDNYRSKCFNSPPKMKHRYEYTIENDSITDIEKYYGYIEKKYMGVNY